MELFRWKKAPIEDLEALALGLVASPVRSETGKLSALAQQTVVNQGLR
jgi:hypothetical protein